MALNLGERRIYQEFRNDPYIKDFEAHIQKITGQPTKVEVDWASIENTEQASWVLRDQAKWVRTYMFTSMDEGVAEICADSLGKEAFNEKIKKISMINSENTGLTVENGVLTMKVSLRGNGVYDGKSVASFLESNL